MVSRISLNNVSSSGYLSETGMISLRDIRILFSVLDGPVSFDVGVMSPPLGLPFLYAYLSTLSKENSSYSMPRYATSHPLIQTKSCEYDCTCHFRLYSR